MITLAFSWLAANAHAASLGLWDLSVDLLCRALCSLFSSRHRTVPAAEDPSRPLLRQFAIVRATSWIGRRYGALYLQHFITPESLDWAHRHRWAHMRSWVLSGYFIEERLPHVELIAHVAPSSYDMRATVIHRVSAWSEKCWTLFHMSPEVSDNWGYYRIVDRKAATHRVLGPFIHWRAHIVKRVPSLDTGKVA